MKFAPYWILCCQKLVFFFCFYFCLPLNNACFHCSQAQSDLFRISVNLLVLTFKHDLSRTTLRLGNIFRGNILRTLYGAQVFWGLSTWLVATKLLPLLATGLFLLFLSSNVLFDFKWLLSYMCRSVTAENSRGYFYRLLKCILSLSLFLSPCSLPASLLYNTAPCKFWPRLHCTMKFICSVKLCCGLALYVAAAKLFIVIESIASLLIGSLSPREHYSVLRNVSLHILSDVLISI